jgi:predicted nucleic acid-binding protein
VVLTFAEKAALAWARLMADGTAKGRPRSPLDMIIAAVAEVNHCVIVTQNERDFAGLKIVCRRKVIMSYLRKVEMSY